MNGQEKFRSERKSIELNSCLRVLHRRLHLIVILTILSLTGTAIYEFKMPEFYEASSLVRLRILTHYGLSHQQNSVVDLKTATQLVTTSLTAEEALKLIRGKKSGVNDSVRQHLGSLSAQDVLDFISAKSYQPDLIRISVKHTSPEVAAVLANAVAEAFIARLGREILSEASDERRFIETQLQALHIGLQRLDKQILEVERQLSAVNVPGEVAMLVNFVKIFSTELMMVEAEIRNELSMKEQSQQTYKQLALSQRAFEFEHRRVGLDEKIKFLTTLLQQTHRQLRRFPEQQRKLRDLVRQLQVLGQAYISLLSRLQGVKAKESEGFNSAIVINPAFVPDKPVGLGLVWLFFFTISSSLAIGVGLSFLLEIVKPVVRSSDELKQILGVSTLSVIPRVKLKMEFDSLKRFMTSRQIGAEAVRTLRANLRFIIRQSSDREMKALLITSSLKGEGKSFVTAALGIAFAQIGKRTVVVDANLLNPELHKFFGVDGTIGLADVLKGVASLDKALKEAQTENLKLLPAGAHHKGSTITPAELFDPEAIAQLLQRLREKFDLVLIDAPPMMEVTDPSILASIVDGVLLVVELGYVTKTVIQSVKRQIDLAQAKILGVIINKAPRKRGYEFHSDYYCYLS